MLRGIFKEPLIYFPRHRFRFSMTDNFAFNSVLVCDISVTVRFNKFFYFMCDGLLFVLFALCKCSVFILRLEFSNNIESFLYIVNKSKLIIYPYR